MIASDEPWVRQPVVSPGAWKRSASIRTQRCSISAEIGYSAWSMKLRVQVLGDDPLRLGLHPRRDERREVALRVALHRQVLADQPHRVDRAHPALGEVVDGAASVRNRLPKRASASVSLMSCHGLLLNHRSCRSGCVECLDDPADREADRAGERPPVDEADVDRAGGGRPGERREAGEEEQHRAELVDRHHPPADDVGAAPARARHPRRASPGGPRPRKQTQPGCRGARSSRWTGGA